VKVVIERFENFLTMGIEDNGRGFQAVAPAIAGGPAHFGILGMRERAAALDGDFEVQSKPGTGTRIRLRLPAPEAVPPVREVQETHA
jgi:two-component system, NarL family, sensor histidine kinase DegS